MNSPQLCTCGKPAEWAGECSHNCWEAYTNRRWQELIKTIEKDSKNA